MAHRLRDSIRSRADDRCEYCRLAQQAEPLFTFHVEHIIAKQHGGKDKADNLAWSCHYCNLHKGPNLTGIDLATGATVRLFHPRNDRWIEHFELIAGAIIGRTPIGRTTVKLLRMNDAGRLELRLECLKEDAPE